ncbi:MAG: formylglycine-generating enzyme family protein [Candidatus Nitronauta litoralis]|uniref:Formylglycine-generating enzyme family protein n=1 Tax=Candidatus Nitronauta litoralis TaxID=2705533 RepID=A0A7T0BTT5_9BACT|nr:MAG: formylglycine-generating enzyme family protein [Candidatus Nitronauta litoralis]
MVKIFFSGLITFLSFVFFLSGCVSIKTSKEYFTTMVEVPAGLFSMGAIIDNPNEWGDTDEEPVHEVYLDRFYIDKFEATAGEFSRFLNDNPHYAQAFIETGPAVTIELKDGVYKPREGLERYPANRISWYGADAYCRWMGKRLPTEAEWEKAARGSDGRTFPWGNKHPDNTLATYRRPFAKHGFQAMEPVDSMPQGASPYGAHHMAGNIWEWVSDWYEDIYYEHSPEKNPQGPETGDHKVMRGGNWYYKAYYMRTTYRFNDPPETFKVWQGVRCAKSAGD